MSSCWPKLIRLARPVLGSRRPAKLRWAPLIWALKRLAGHVPGDTEHPAAETNNMSTGPTPGLLLFIVRPFMQIQFRRRVVLERPPGCSSTRGHLGAPADGRSLWGRASQPGTGCWRRPPLASLVQVQLTRRTVVSQRTSTSGGEPIFGQAPRDPPLSRGANWRANGLDRRLASASSKFNGPLAPSTAQGVARGAVKLLFPPCGPKSSPATARRPGSIRGRRKQNNRGQARAPADR